VCWGPPTSGHGSPTEDRDARHPSGLAFTGKLLLVPARIDVELPVIIDQGMTWYVLHSILLGLVHTCHKSFMTMCNQGSFRGSSAGKMLTGDSQPPGT
jgi:hypothetical protein